MYFYISFFFLFSFYVTVFIGKYILTYLLGQLLLKKCLNRDLVTAFPDIKRGTTFSALHSASLEGYHGVKLS